MIEDFAKILMIFCTVGLPVLLIFGRPFIRQWFELKSKQLDVEARLAAEKAAQYATANATLETRVRVLEQIVTDRGIETASQIEALRDTPRLQSGERFS
jgi:hypothetical protein